MYNNSKIIQGLMRLNDISVEELEDLLKFDLENGITFLDISDIYGNGACEEKLGQVFSRNPELRDKFFIQTKCGIVRLDDGKQTYYDLSYEHIIDSVNNSLNRMEIDSIDCLLLHRPDIFLDAKEVARAFATLLQQGKVKHFGVSNFPHEMMKYIKDQTNIPIEVNQLQLGLGHLALVREVFNVNTNHDSGIERTGELFFYMKRYGVKLQCWSPYQYGFFEGSIFKKEEMKDTVVYLEELGKKYNVAPASIATSFLLMLGDNIQVITGSTNKKQIKESIDGCNVKLTKEEWYILYRSTHNLLP